MSNETSNTPRRGKHEEKDKRIWYIAGTVIAALLIGWLVFTTVKATRKAAALEVEKEQLEIKQAQENLEREYQDLNGLGTIKLLKISDMRNFFIYKYL